MSQQATIRIRQPKYWSFSFSISPSNEYSQFISFSLFVVQGTRKCLLQHHNSKASIFPRSAFFMVQLSYPYMVTGKTIALTTRTFVSKMMSLLFNTLSRFVIAFLPRSKCLLILWLQYTHDHLIKYSSLVPTLSLLQCLCHYKQYESFCRKLFFTL